MVGYILQIILWLCDNVVSFKVKFQKFIGIIKRKSNAAKATKNSLQKEDIILDNTLKSLRLLEEIHILLKFRLNLYIRLKKKTESEIENIKNNKESSFIWFIFSISLLSVRLYQSERALIKAQLDFYKSFDFLMDAIKKEYTSENPQILLFSLILDSLKKIDSYWRFAIPEKLEIIYLTESFVKKLNQEFKELLTNKKGNFDLTLLNAFKKNQEIWLLIFTNEKKLFEQDTKKFKELKVFVKE